LKKPNLFLVGHPRTGTSALHNALNQHPDIFMSIPKEPVYFAKDLHEESDLFHGKKKYFHYRDEVQYLKIFKSARHHTVTGESTAVYLYSKVAAMEIHRFNPESKIIMMFREPTNWLCSYHAKACQILGEDHLNLSDALQLEDERKMGKYLSRNVMAPSLLFYTEFLKYRNQVERYTALFDPENIKIILYDDYKKDNLKIFKEILEFLGLDTDFVAGFKKINASKSAAKWPLIQGIIQFPYITKIALKLLPQSLFGKLSLYYWENFFQTKEDKKIEPQLKKTLMNKFRSEVEQLGEFLNINLVDMWGYNTI
jgi:hypothetical protein